MSVDRNEKIWSYTYSGKMMHAFIQQHPGNPNLKRAMCRATVAIGRVSWQDLRGREGNQGRLCKACLKLANAMWDRAEASMEPADPYSDGFHTVDETTATANREAKRKFVGRKPLDIDALHAEALAEDETRWETENNLYNRYDRIGVLRPGVADALTIAHREAMATLPRPQRTEAQRNATRDTLRRAVNLRW